MTFTAPLTPEERLRELWEHSGPSAVAAQLLGFHPVEMVESLECLAADERYDVIAFLPNRATAQILLLSDAEFRAGLMERLDNERLASVFDRLPAEDAVDLLDEIEEERAHAILAAMAPERARQLETLRSYPGNSVGHLMTRSFPRVTDDLTVTEALGYLRAANADIDTMHDIYIVDDDAHLVGVMSLRELVMARPDRSLSDVMQTRIVSVTAETDQEAAANLISRYNLLALPVVDDRHRLLGLVTIDDLVDVLIREGTEDVLRMGGVGGTTDAAESTSYWSGRIGAVVQKRIPWLLLLFVAGTLTSWVMGFHDSLLKAETALALFIPLLIGTGGNAGSQAVTTIVRGLAVGEIRGRDALRVVAREALTGIVMGVVLGLIALGYVMLTHGNLALAGGVAVAIMTICVWANTVGSLIPIVADKLKIDPTVVSAPFITTVVDATGLVIYFSIARLFLRL